MRIPLFIPREDIEVWLKRYDAITQRTGLSDYLKAEYLVNSVRNDVAECITTYIIFYEIQIPAEVGSFAHMQRSQVYHVSARPCGFPSA